MKSKKLFCRRITSKKKVTTVKMGVWELKKSIHLKKKSYTGHIYGEYTDIHFNNTQNKFSESSITAIRYIQRFGQR